MKFYSKLLLAVLVLSGANICASHFKDPELKLEVYNGLNRRIKVTWQTKAGKEVYQIFSPEESKEISSFDRLGKDMKMKFEVYGKAFGWSAWPVSVDKPELVKQAYKLQPFTEEALKVMVLQGIKSFSLHLDYAKYELKKEEVDPKDILGLFTGLSYYPEIQKSISEKMIREFTSWKVLIYSVEDGRQIATAEDVYRYMLGVGTGYSHTEVKNAYNMWMLEWHSDSSKEEDKERLSLATNVISLVKKAYDGLKEALREKAEPLKEEGLDDFVFVGSEASEEAEPVEERSIVPATE